MPSPDMGPLLPDDDEVGRRAEALVAEVRGAEGRSTARSRRRATRMPLAIALTAALSTAGVAGATALFAGDDVGVASGIGCYDSTDLDTASITIIRPTADPVRACRALWRRGTVRAGATSAPRLVACSERGDAVRVFPSEDRRICDRLDLRPLPSDYAPIGARAAAVRDAVGDLEDLTTVCRPIEQVTRLVHERLRRAELRDVPVTLVDRGGDCAFADADGTAVRIYAGVGG